MIGFVVGLVSGGLAIWQGVEEYILDRGRPYLGVETVNTHPQVSAAFGAPTVAEEDPANTLPNVEIDANEIDVEGVLITRITHGGPADRAGLEVEDIIVALGETAVEDQVQLERTLTADYEPGDTVRITLVRGLGVDDFDIGDMSKVNSRQVRATLERF